MELRHHLSSFYCLSGSLRGEGFSDTHLTISAAPGLHNSDTRWLPVTQKLILFFTLRVLAFLV